jgi:hypothetical protein
MAMKLRSIPYLDTRTIFLAIFAGVLVWLVISRSFAAYLADVNPTAALWLNPQQSQALINLADQTFNSLPTTDTAAPKHATEVKDEHDSGATVDNKGSLDQAFAAIDSRRTVDLATVRAWAEAALLTDPVNASAPRILGQLADAANDENAAQGFMRAAAQRSLRESISLYWLLLKSARAKDSEATIYYADALLRARPQLAGNVLPILAQLAQDPRSRDLLINVLKTDPPWRASLIAGLPDYVTDARIPLEVLLALTKSSAAPTPRDIRPYLHALIAHEFYDLAYYTWLQFLPPVELGRTGLLYNGDFEDPFSGLPFDWEIMPGAGVTIDVVRPSENSDEHALLIDFQYGRVDFRGVRELVRLSPGDYQFTAKYKGDLVGPRGLKWRISCVDGGAPVIAESPMIIGRAADWRDIAIKFTVPGKGCRAQYVRLDLDARSQSEQLVSGSVYFNRLQIARARNAT